MRQVWEASAADVALVCPDDSPCPGKTVLHIAAFRGERADVWWRTRIYRQSAP